MKSKNSMAIGWPDVLITLDHNKKIKSIEGNGSQVWGYEPIELIGYLFSRLFDKDSYQSFEAYFQDPNSDSLLHKAMGTNKLGELFPLEVYVKRVSDCYIAMVKIVGVAEQANDTLDFLLPTINHELKNPLNSIIGLSNLLLQNAPREDQQELIQSLKFSSEQLMALINDLVNYSQIQAMGYKIESHDFDLRFLINSIRYSFIHLSVTKDIQFDIQVHENVPELVHGDSTRLSQILYNLIGNAFKFTKYGSIIIDVSAQKVKDYFLISFMVEDTGIGIAKDKVETIFQPFEQAYKSSAKKYGGKGLGLSIVKNLVYLMNGKIEVKSRLGKGSCFNLELPFQQAHNSVPTNRTSKIEENNFNIKVLYVEDQESNRLLMKGFCAKKGVSPDFAINGAEALEKIKNNSYDIVLLDLNLAGEDGLELALQIKQIDESRKIPVIAVTAEQIDKEWLGKYGINDILIKPLNQENLYQLCKKYVGKGDEDDDNSRNSFAIFDSLYENKPEEYRSLLKVMIEEYGQFKKDLFSALQLRDDSGYRRIVHSMKSNLLALGMTEFVDRLNVLKTMDSESMDESALNDTVECLSGFFNQLEKTIFAKISDIRDS